ncbi:DUF2200 domain-containing protein [Salinibius halmophilus]|uniref:DUF2200 domain-containing protein n=1 Tax=Salinibius halmophilus TaxID=1853216 RepID=UPI000E66D09F|nr:DUF2200 domain-containing protein [Salinibius halmophilus]
MASKNEERLYAMQWQSLYPSYVKKAERKSRTQEEVNQIISWLTGYQPEQFAGDNQQTVREFFEQAPQLHANRMLITGSVCGVKLAEITDPLMREIRYLDKLIDELAKGKSMDKILRRSE